MSFQIKDFRSILAAMVNLVRGATDKLSDFNPGSVVRTVLEAPSAEIEELYLQFFIGVQEAIPVAIYDAFQFSRLGAVAAYGNVTFYATTPPLSPVPIPVGTSIQTPSGLVFTTVEEKSIAIGDPSALVRVQCSRVGTIGNVPAGSITVLQQTINGVSSCDNLEAFVTGLDEETDTERKARFAEYIASRDRSTKAALQYGAEQVRLLGPDGSVSEYVRSAVILEEFMTDSTKPVGFVRVIISSGVGGASTELVDEAQKVVDGYVDIDGTSYVGWKAAGVIATVESAVPVPVGIVGTLVGDETVSTEDLEESVEYALRAYVAALGMGDDVLRSELIAAALSVDGVYNYTLTTPPIDVAIGVNEIAVTDSVTFA